MQKPLVASKIIVKMILMLSCMGAVLLIIFVLLFGESASLKATFIGKLHRGLTLKLPVFIENATKRLLGTYLYSKIISASSFIMNERHPIVQTFYLALITGGLIIFVIDAAPKIPNKYVSEGEWIPIIFTIVFTYGSFWKASTSGMFVNLHRSWILGFAKRKNSSKDLG